MDLCLKDLKHQMSQLREFDFAERASAGLLIVAGGFEERAITFSKKLKKSVCSLERTLVLHYENQADDNSPNYEKLKTKLRSLTGEKSLLCTVHADKPIQSSRSIEKKIRELAGTVQDRTAIVDISGMTHLWALTTIHSCLRSGLHTLVVYTEAKTYFPTRKVRSRLLSAWKAQEYEVAAEYLQSAGLKEVQILPEFAGNFRPGTQTCLIVFVGYEPNRIKGLVDIYAPGAMMVFYGRPPHQEFSWRTRLSHELHEELFSQWLVRRGEVSTLEVNQILKALEEEYRTIRERYDVAIAPQCSKMQALASYLFWRRHPEVQLLFTSPVRFNPSNYSKGAGRTFTYEIGSS